MCKQNGRKVDCVHKLDKSGMKLKDYGFHLQQAIISDIVAVLLHDVSGRVLG